MQTSTKPQTVGELRDSGYQVVPVKEEMRANMVARLRRNEPLFPGIIGYEQTVIPQIENAILSGQDIIFLGERGQAKTRIARSLINLLDDEVPIIAGSEINDNPYAPISAQGRRMAEEMGDDLPVE
jgi:magnesium chelatase subunit I